jgi:DNA primase
MPRAEDRILLLLAIKEVGKWIDFEHITEKTIRDEEGRITAEDVKKILNNLEERGLIERRENNYIITDEGRKEAVHRVRSAGEGLNLSYRRVLFAKQYYPKAAEAMIPYLEGRATSVVKVFSDEKDPLRKIKPLFVRYSKYKPKKTFITIESAEDLLSYVNAHAIDFIPYVHRLESPKPDWLVLDLDAGPEFKHYEKGFELVKIVAKQVVDVLREYEIEPCVKFSGSRGIQVWASLDNSKLHAGDLFAEYRNLAVFIQGEVEKRLQESEYVDEFYKVTKRGKPITTSTVAKKNERADQILIDWSSMKPNGDVRAPFSIHYKTGLVSCPIAPEHLMDFQIEEAYPEDVMGKIESLRKYFELAQCDPSKLLRAAKR